MKNIFRFLMAVAILFTASCAKEEISSSIGGGEVEVTFTANLAGIGTRAIADGTTVDRVYVAIFDATSKTHLSELTLPEGYPVSNGQASMTVVLLRDKKYDLVFWAQKDGTGAYTLDLAHRKVKANYGAAANNEARDAFFRIDNNWVAGVGSTTFELRRPFAQINAGNSDADVKYVNANGSVITESSMTVITEIYDTLDLTDGSLTGNEVSAEFTLAAIPSQTIAGTVDPTHDATLNASAEYNYLAMNYLLVSDRQLVDLVFNYTDGTTTFERKYFQVPVQRNYRTNILGQLISSPMDFNVIIVPDFNTPDEVVEPIVDAATLKSTIESAAAGELTEIILGSDIYMDTLLSRAAESNSINIAAGQKIAINLNGYKIIGTDTITASYGLFSNKGELTINDYVGTGKIVLSATQERGWNAYSSVISNNPGGKLVVNGGTIEHLGGTSMAYGIDNLTNGKGTSAEATINGGTVKSTYRAIRQFLNGIEANNSLTVNGGVIEGANKSIWMQDPSKNANTGTLVVAADAQLNGDVYLTVTAGSTEWPVSVAVADAALKNGSAVLVSNLPVGHAVINEDGVWKNIYDNSGISTVDALKEALADTSVATITLAPNAVFEGTFAVSRNVTISTAYANNKATIKGRVNIDSNASGATFENIKFDINDASAAKNTFTGANYKYPAIVTIYAAATNFEGCEFKCDISKGVCGINYGSHSAGNKLVVNNCKFTGDFYAIRTRTLFSITNSIFDVYTAQGKLAAVWTWGNGTAGTKLDSRANTVVFTGNTNLNDNEVFGVQLTSTNFNYCHISYNFQSNSGFTTLANSLGSNCDYTGKTFAEGSETF